MDIYVGGFVFSEETIARLCIDAYNYTQRAVDNAGSIDLADMYFEERYPLDSPNFIEMNVRSKDQPNVDRTVWILPCRLGMVNRGKPRPELPFDEAAESYADYWFPRHLRESPAFRHVKYVQCQFPRDVYSACACGNLRWRVRSHTGILFV